MKHGPCVYCGVEPDSFESTFCTEAPGGARHFFALPGWDVPPSPPRYAASWIVRRLEGLREYLFRPGWINYVMGGKPKMFGDNTRLQKCPRCGRLDATLIIPALKGPLDQPIQMRCRVCHKREKRRDGR